MTYSLGMMRESRARATLAVMRSLLVLAITALTGCAYSPEPEPLLPTEYTFRFEGSAQERIAFAQALNEWNACGVVHGELADQGVRVMPVSGFPWAPELAAVTFIEHNQKVPLWISYRPDAERLREIFGHELGHAFFGNTEHTPHGLMSTEMASEEHVGPAECSRLLAGR